MQAVRIVRINPFGQPEMVKASVGVYQKAFGGEPWNEGWVCPVCKAEYPLAADLVTCPECAKTQKSVLVVEYWPEAKVTTDFYLEMQKPEAVCVVAMAQDTVIGFAWGYQVKVSPELDDYLEAPGLHTNLSGEFPYLDEGAVLPPWQGQGIGARLVRAIFALQGEKRFLLRTKDGSRMSKIIEKMGGSVAQRISRGRVIMQIDRA